MKPTLLKKPSLVRERVTDAEWHLRCELAAAHRLVAHFVFVDMTYNHISARVPGEASHFLVKADNVFMEQVTASNLVKYDVDGNKVQTLITEPVSLGHFLSPAWSPDNEHVAFVNNDKDEQGAVQLQVSDPDDAQLWTGVQFALPLRERTQLILSGSLRQGRDFSHPVYESGGAAVRFRLGRYFAVSPIYQFVATQYYPGIHTRENRLSMNGVVRMFLPVARSSTKK